MDLIRRVCREYDVPEDVLRAVIQAESSGYIWAIRYEPDFAWLVVPEEYCWGQQTVETERKAQKTSWGLMQVMGATARGIGYEGRFLAGTLDPETNLKLGAKYLRQKYDIYKTWLDAIAAYNAGSARKEKGTKDYVNQRYVDMVMGFRDSTQEWDWEIEYEQGFWTALIRAVRSILSEKEW